MKKSRVNGNIKVNFQIKVHRVKKIFYLFSCVLLFFLGLLIRYQIVDSICGAKYTKPAVLQRREYVPVSIARGKILDRNGIPLHNPYWHAALAVFPSQIDDHASFASEVAPLTDLSENYIKEVLLTETAPFKLLREIPLTRAKEIILRSIPGLIVIPEEIRYGPYSLARHVVGHIRPNAYFNAKDNVGESGLESWFQTELSGGESAWVGTLVTGEGRPIPGSSVRIGSIRGPQTNLLTTIDINIQQKVEQVLDNNTISKGAVVVLDVGSGDIMAMASRPQYDQNHPENYFQLLNSPFVNRCITDFTPGSIWKTVVLALALEKGYVSPDEIFECKGQILLGSTAVNCGTSNEGHGPITLKEALAQSCNCALIQVGLRISPEELVNWAQECFFGNKLRTPLSQESSGKLPELHAMMPGDVANYTIGQGYLTVTPLQIACFYRSIVCDGKWVSPTLIPDSVTMEKTLFSKSTAKFLQEALLLSTQNGTGGSAWISGFGSAGKTGTAEISDEYSSDHAWFVGWTPVLAPEYVICVFCERTGSGPSLAAPLFKQIGEQLLEG